MRERESFDYDASQHSSVIGNNLKSKIGNLFYKKAYSRARNLKHNLEMR